ncbi:hypothetical protein OAF83_03375 [Rubripirellula sp.]|jgi:hypothetical protein|nr:hypothetical protein [Rubripirellula sp.]MDB4749925.1 hypothetical protein [Rubripirellula sp.]
MFTTQTQEKRYLGQCLVFMVALACLFSFLAGTSGAANPTGIPNYLIVQPDAPSGSGQINRLQMNSTKPGSYKTNPKWLKHHNKLKQRRLVAASLKRQAARSKDYSHVSLNYRINVDITNPMGISPWGSHYRRNWHYHYRPSWMYVPRVSVPLVTSSGHHR